MYDFCFAMASKRRRIQEEEQGVFSIARLKQTVIWGKVLRQIAFSNPDLEPHIYIHFNDEDAEVNSIN